MCLSFGGINPLSVAGKVYGRVVIERVKICTENELLDVWVSFRDEREIKFAVSELYARKIWKRTKVCNWHLWIQKRLTIMERNAF